MILSGDNTVEGSPGYAGIYVAKEASLTVQGDGSLSATGGRSATIDEDLPNNVSGYWGSGAGIGGNGVWAYGNDTWVDGSSPNFGTIQIEEGTINAVGGERKNTNVGGGAGIGSGSCSSWGTLIELEGTINISGGIITSVGGDSNDEARSLTGGGAGIGSCGVTGNKFVPYNNNVKVSISGGNITATGKADGAGIGGGANVNGGKIEITGGTVYAEGGYEIGINGSNGGAGIGGGDMGSAESIEISGGTITAKGGGAAAGIGGGYGDIYTDSGYCGTINISGDADIEATGGSNGGPGIGPGKQFFVDISEDEVSQYQNEINISNGKIKATGGGSNAAGIGGLSHTDVVINIRGGEIEATGGSYGAGIGGGNNYNYYGRNDPTVDESRHSGLVEINILGGNIKASGGKYASGIGAGAYGRAANVSISGGYVEATGGCDDKNYGAAGVGSGYWPGYYENIFSDKVFEINITGGTVIAKGRGDERGGAGIGLGASDYEPVKINISGGEVWAYGGGSANGIGGSYYGNFYGTTEIAITGGNVVATGGKFASGIGSGQKGGAVNISITGDAKVNAYGQTFAYAIGKSYETTGAVALTLSDTITLWAQNGDKENLAIPANTKYIRQSESGSIYLATYTDAATTNPESVETNAANKASGRLTDDVATEDNAVSLDWMYKAPQYVTLNGLVEIDTLLEQTSIPGNWATLYSTPKITVSYEWTAGNHPTDVTAPADDVIETGTKYTAKEQDASMQGYRFDGWYTDEGCTQEYQNGSMLNNDTTLYGKWDKLYTVSYDPNGGSGTMTDSNSPYVYGASVTIMENTFIRENYHFTGWNTASDGSGKSYSAGDNYTIEDDITLYAQWKKNTVTPLDPTDPTNPTKPVKPAKPMEPTKPAESNPNTEATLPQTGDDTNVFLWMALLVVSCGGLAGTFAFKKRRTIK